MSARRSAELAVQIEGGADQRQMGEGLREVAKLLTRRPDLLRVQPQVVCIAEHLFEDQSGLVEPAGPGEGFHPLERAQ